MNRTLPKEKELSYTQASYENYQEMVDYADGWDLLCNYQLTPIAINGHYKILELPTMQLAFSDNIGGLMYNFDAPKDTICISVIKYVEGKASLDSIKLQTGDIVFFDDSKRYTFMASARTKLLDISIKKSTNSILYHRVLKAYQKTILDTDKKLQILLLNIIEEYRDIESLDIEQALALEREITTTILSLLEDQEPQIRKLTRGEQVVVNIRDNSLFFMDKTITIHSLSNDYKLSEKTLQTSFRSFFDFTPSKFLRLLKLNLVRNDLIESTPEDKTVISLAQKWGFTHMGRFTQYYKELFLETPFTTLKTISKSEGLNDGCVKREGGDNF